MEVVVFGEGMSGAVAEPRREFARKFSSDAFFVKIRLYSLSFGDDLISVCHSFKWVRIWCKLIW